jgi:dTDP-4-dehydrorhamnose 3,5-epimerase
MKKIETGFEGLYIVETINFTDNRGSFQKLFNSEWFIENDLSVDFKEFYYSVSHKDVIRGMHFQLPPHEHTKLVYVSKGSIVDVVVDLRTNSKTYGQYFSSRLNDTDARYLYIPSGFAHGFLSLEDNTIVNYAQTSGYNKEADCGITYNSFGFDWDVQFPIISERDLTFEKLENFKSVF